jgi:hypothetical protein
MTVRGLLTRSIRMLVASTIAPGRSASETELDVALEICNQMLANWRLKRTIAWQILRTLHTLTASLNPHTIGSSGTFNTTRPVKIERAGLVVDDNEYPLIGPLTPSEWSRISDKLTEGTPARFYYEPAFPLGKIHLNPITAAADQLALYTWIPLTAFADLDDDVELPDGYEVAIAANLAIELGPEWQREVNPLTVMLARNSLYDIKHVNRPSLEMRCDTAALGDGPGGSYRMIDGNLG